MHDLLVTGGAGFIGSHVVARLVEEFPKANIVILDKMTYAADIKNLSGALQGNMRRLAIGDVCDFELCCRLTKKVDCVIHMAAESHVDNAFGNSLQFTRSNTLGTHTLLEASRLNNIPLFIHVSTDEVYGEIRDGTFDENSILNPSNPYSGSKAGAEMIVSCYRHSFQMPIITVRSNNIFGTRQYPEKIIPKFCMQALTGNKMTIHGDGNNRRRFLAVADFAEALILLLHRGKVGDIYNVGSEQEYSNLQIAEMICAHFAVDFEEGVEFVADRPFNDFRYAVEYEKLLKLGWKPKHLLKDTIGDVALWYANNRDRYNDLFPEPGDSQKKANVLSSEKVAS